MSSGSDSWEKKIINIIKIINVATIPSFEFFELLILKFFTLRVFKGLLINPCAVGIFFNLSSK